MIGGLAAAAAIVIFVMAHELGHFVVAKATGMKVTQFFFGFGPRLWSTQRGETEYGVKLLPLGGYVRILGMTREEPVDPEDAGRTYVEKPFWAKSAAVLAGVLMNFVIAYLMFFGILLYEGVVEYVPAIDEVLVTLDDGSPSPAAAAGLQAGDRFVSLDGVSLESWSDTQEAIWERPGATVEIVVERDGELVAVVGTLSDRLSPTGSGETIGFLGVVPDSARRPIGTFTAAGVAGRAVGESVQLTFDFLGRLITPDSLIELGRVFIGDTDVPDEIRVTSPLGLVQIGANSELGTTTLLWILASVNIVLGVLNGLPLYPLDGGHFAVALYEKITRRQADIRALVPVAAAVLALVAFLGIAAIILDIFNPIQLPG